jgi:ketosteroid isomerase-like protein
MNQGSDSKEIVMVLDKYKSAVFAKDVESFLSLYDDNVQVFDMWGSWSYKGIASWRKMVAEWFGSLGNERVRVEMSEIQTKTISNFGYASAIVKYSAVSSEGEVLRWLENRMTMVLELVGPDWKIVHEHTSAPTDPETLKVSLKRN